MLVGRVAALFAIRDGGHGRHADFLEALNGLPLLAGPQYRKLGSEQVLEDFGPANATVDFHEEPVAVDFRA
ncbi:hypothetical protein D3C78_1705180 [compost metagenome]